MPRLRAGGVAVQFLAAGGDVPGQHECAGDERESALAMLGDVLAEEGRCPNLTVIRSVADLDAVLAGDRIGLVLHLEGAKPLTSADDVLAAGFMEGLEELHSLGVRSLQPTWNGPNAFADGVGVADPKGLTALGRDLVAGLDRLGILIDVAHLAEPSFWDLLEIARGPVVASHANAAAVHSHRRNLTDEQIRAIAGTGGFVGVCFIGDFIGEPVTVERVTDHVDHLVEVAGIDGVGIGADYVEFAVDLMVDPGQDEGYLGPEGLRRVETLPVLTAALLRRGYAEEDVAKILGGNPLRALRETLSRSPS
jgi:membrane dipeptidase